MPESCWAKFCRRFLAAPWSQQTITKWNRCILSSFLINLLCTYVLWTLTVLNFSSNCLSCRHWSSRRAWLFQNFSNVFDTSARSASNLHTDTDTDRHHHHDTQTLGSVTSVIESKDTLLPVSLSCHLASIHQRALILFIQTLALYKSFTYLLTYLLTIRELTFKQNAKVTDNLWILSHGIL